MAIDPDIKYGDFDLEETYRDIYLESGYNDSYINRQRVTDYMEFEINDGAKVKLADLLLQHYTAGIDDSPVNVFSGIAVRILREKTVNNEVLIQRNSLCKGKNRVKSSNQIFEKYFDIYVDNSNTIDTLLPEQTKLALVELYERYGIRFEVSIKYNCIYIRFFTGNLFEQRGWNLLNKKRLHREYLIFKSILQMINKINEIC